MSGIEGPGVIGGGGGGGAPTTSEFVTVDDETGTLPNSRQLVAGDNITFDTTTPGELEINATGGGSSVPTTVQGDTLFASAANTLSALAKDTNATRYLANTGTNNNTAWAQVNLANGVTGNLPVSNLNSGTAADATTFWRGDSTWAVPAGAGQTSGSFVATFGGLTVAQAQTIAWIKIGSLVILSVDPSGMSGTSNATTFSTSAAPLPVAIRPAATTLWVGQISATNNGAATVAGLRVQNNGNLVYGTYVPTTGIYNASGWTASGTKAINGGSDTCLNFLYTV